MSYMLELTLTQLVKIQHTVLTLASSLNESIMSLVATSLCMGAPQFFTQASNTLAWYKYDQTTLFRDDIFYKLSTMCSYTVHSNFCIYFIQNWPIDPFEHFIINNCL